MSKSTELDRKGWEWAAVPADVIMSKVLSHADVRVYSYLLWRSGKKGQSWPTTEKIAEDLNMSDQSVRRSLKNLVKEHWIFRQRRFMGSSITFIFEKQKDCIEFSRSSHKLADRSSHQLDDVRTTSDTTVVPQVRRQNKNNRTIVNEQDQNPIGFKTADIKAAFSACVNYPINWAAGSGAAAKWLAENGYTPDDVIGCYKSMAADSWWSDKQITLKNISVKIGAWKSNNTKPVEKELVFS